MRMAAELRPDAITLDVMMPGMDGWTVLTRLKSDAELAVIPVVMVTMVDQKEMGYTLGVSDYLTKPVDRDKLRTIIKRYLPDQDAGLALIIEDDMALREMTRRTLEKEGWAVVEAENGKVALQKLETLNPQFMLLDLSMPEMDGFTFVNSVKKIDRLRHVPIIVVTALDLSDDERRRLNSHVEKILVKGAYRLADLVEEIKARVEAQAPLDAVAAG